MRLDCRNGDGHRETGASLVVAMITLVAMSLAAVALVRSVETGVLIAGNQAFRQAALMASDAGAQAALAWLEPRAVLPILYTDQPDAGYYASVPDRFDAKGTGANQAKVVVDWDNNACKDSSATLQCVKPGPVLTKDAAGNTARYIIHRLCKSSGSAFDASNSCLMYRGAGTGSAKRGALAYDEALRFESNPSQYYRVITRVEGPRHTRVFTQIVVRF